MKRIIILKYFLLIVMLVPFVTFAKENFFSIYSDKREVIKVMGKPDEIRSKETGMASVLIYGKSSVEIPNYFYNHVIAWDNKGELKIKLTPRNHVTKLNYFTKGSHLDDVIRLQGTPERIEFVSHNYPISGYQIWHYGKSKVRIIIETMKVIDWEKYADKVLDWENHGNLKVKEITTNNKTSIKEAPEDEAPDTIPITKNYNWQRASANILLQNKKKKKQKKSKIQDNSVFMMNFCNEKDSGFYNAPNQQTKYIYTTTQELDDNTEFIDIDGDVSAAGTIYHSDNLTTSDLTTTTTTNFYGTTTEYDNVQFDDYNLGCGKVISGTRTTTGNITFGEWRTSDGRNIYGTSEKIGDYIFHDYQDDEGNHYTGKTSTIGNTTFTETTQWNDWKGAWGKD